MQKILQPVSDIIESMTQEIFFIQTGVRDTFQNTPMTNCIKVIK